MKCNKCGSSVVLNLYGSVRWVSCSNEECDWQSSPVCIPGRELYDKLVGEIKAGEPEEHQDLAVFVKGLESSVRNLTNRVFAVEQANDDKLELITERLDGFDDHFEELEEKLIGNQINDQADNTKEIGRINDRIRATDKWILEVKIDVLDALRRKISSLQDQHKELEVKLDDKIESLDETRYKKLCGLEATLEVIAKRFELFDQGHLDRAHKDYQELVDEHDERITEIVSHIASLKERQEYTSNRLTNARDRLDGRIDELVVSNSTKTDDRFTKIDGRLDEIDERQEYTSNHLTNARDRLDVRIDELVSHIGKIDEYINMTDGRLAGIEGRLTRIEDRFTDEFSNGPARTGHLAEIDNRLNSVIVETTGRFVRIEDRLEERLTKTDGRLDGIDEFLNR